MSLDTLFDRIGQSIVKRLESQTQGYEPYTPSDPITLQSCLKPGDILLVEGDRKISSAIKYLTQSTWSHAAFFIGDALADTAGATQQLIEVELGEGCISSPLSKYACYNTRICRPVGLSDRDRDALVAFMISRIGVNYDLKNIFDLVRYLFPTPPVPIRWRRRMIALGSGEPTRAICSTLIAQAFQSIRYPILPHVEAVGSTETAAESRFSREEILHIRHHSLFTPRDFDLSPYFAVIKPTLERGFDHRALNWAHGVSDQAFDVLGPG